MEKFNFIKIVITITIIQGFINQVKNQKILNFSLSKIAKTELNNIFPEIQLLLLTKMIILGVVSSFLISPTISFGSEKFSPGSKDLYIIDFNFKTKEIISNDSCKEAWPFKDELLKRVITAKSKELDFDKKNYEIKRKNEFCFLLFLKNKNMQGEGREECKESIVYEQKDHIVIDTNQQLFNGTNRQIIVAGKDRCILLLNQKISEGFSVLTKNRKDAANDTKLQLSNLSINDDDLGFIADKEIKTDSGNPEKTCEILGKWKCYDFSKEKGMTNELKQRYLKKACDLENQVACEEIGFNCQKGNFKACVSDALDFEEKKNYIKAFELYKISCLNGIEKGCSFALLLAEKIKDKKMELSFNEVMCNQGMINGCKDLALHYYEKGNNTKELIYQKKGCDLKDYRMCFSAGLILSSQGKFEESLPWISNACENKFMKACEYLKKIPAKTPEISSSPELEKCQKGKLEICTQNYSLYLKKSLFKEAAPFLIAACANDDYISCTIIADLWEKAGEKKQAEGFRQQGLISANKRCNQNDSKACEMKCGIMANLNSSAYELNECLKASCQKGNSKSCEIRAKINNQINKNNNDHAKKRKIIENEIEENNRRADLFKGLSKTAEEISNAFKNSFKSNNSIDSYQFKESGKPDNSRTIETPSINGGLGCGIKPIPKIGCHIGRCVDGAWEQICDANSTLSCGIRPIPNIGCRIGRCVDGAWEQICDANSTLSCGIKPLPKIGCRIGRCVDGRWEQICN